MEREQHEGRNVARKRRSLGMTQRYLAKAAGLNEARVSAFETGRAELEADELHRIRKVIKQRAQFVVDSVLVG